MAQAICAHPAGVDGIHLHAVANADIGERLGLGPSKVASNDTATIPGVGTVNVPSGSGAAGAGNVPPGASAPGADTATASTEEGGIETTPTRDPDVPPTPDLDRAIQQNAPAGGSGAGGNGPADQPGPTDAHPHANYFQRHYGFSLANAPPESSMRTIQTSAGPVKVNPAVANDAKNVINQLKQAGAPIRSLGGYNHRGMKAPWAGRWSPSSRASSHAWGAAIDLDNAWGFSHNPQLGQWINSHQSQFNSILAQNNFVRPLPGRDPNHIEWTGPGRGDTQTASAAPLRSPAGMGRGAQLFGRIESDSNANAPVNRVGAGGEFKQKAEFQQRYGGSRSGTVNRNPAYQQRVLANFANQAMRRNPNVTIGDLYANYAHGSAEPWQRLPRSYQQNMLRKMAAMGISPNSPASQFFPMMTAGM